MDPVFNLLSLRAALKPGAKDALIVKATFHAADGTPDAAPEVVIRLGGFAFTARANQFTRKGDKWTFKQKALAIRKVTLDFGKGRVAISLKGVELGSHARGAVQLPLSIEFDDVRFADVPVLSSSGKSLRY